MDINGSINYGNFSKTNSIKPICINNDNNNSSNIAESSSADSNVVIENSDILLNSLDMLALNNSFVINNSSKIEHKEQTDYPSDESQFTVIDYKDDNDLNINTAKSKPWYDYAAQGCFKVVSRFLPKIGGVFLSWLVPTEVGDSTLAGQQKALQDALKKQ